VKDASLKLTAYFAERERAGTRFLAEEMLDLFAERRVATSVMLRGISGFGHRRIIRTDESLTLSEDPAVAVAAVDTPETIRSLTGEVTAMTTSGLITLERARLLEGPVDGALRPEDGDAVKLTIYIGRNRRIAGVPAYKAVCALLRRNGFAGAWVFLGVDGTAHGERRRAHFVSRNTDVPLMIIAVGTTAQVARSMPALQSGLQRPLITVERARLCKRDGILLDRPASLPASDEQGRRLWQKVMVFTSEADRRDGGPIHRALVRRLWESRTASGATVLRGVWGFQGNQEPHGDKVFQFGRRVPVMTVIVDTPQSIAASFDIVDELTAGHGLVTSEMVPALLAIDGDQRHGGTDLADYRY
jgi:PII-like signaling protein